jgi:putative salt-induced outer membrane protein YdiY
MLIKKIFISVCFLVLICPGYSSGNNFQLSYLSTHGNVDSQLINGDCFLKRTDGGVSQELKAGLIYGKKDKLRTTEYWYMNVKDSHYGIDGWAYWYNLSGFEFDDFAGYDIRLSSAIGPGLKYETEEHVLQIEVGSGLIYEEMKNGEKHGFISGRAWEGYHWSITDDFSLEENCEYFYDFDDSGNYRVNSEAAIVGKITNQISVKAGPMVRYVNKPVGDRETTDVTTKVAVIWSF